MKRTKIIPSRISSSYANGFFLVLKTYDQKFVDKVLSDFDLFLDLIGTKSSDTYKKLNSPLINKKDKNTK